MGKNMQAIGALPEAIFHLERALTLNPEAEDIPYIYSHLGDCLKDMDRYEEAIAVLKKGAACDDERPDIHNLLGFCHFKMADYETAISHFNRTVELNPASAIDYANLGVNYRKLEKNEEAIKYLQLALSLDPTISFAQSHLAELVNQ